MIVALALLGVLLLGLLAGLAFRGCLLLGDNRQLDTLVQRLLAEQRVDNLTRNTLAAMRQAAKGHFTSPMGE